jgi:hypothetical protein
MAALESATSALIQDGRSIYCLPTDANHDRRSCRFA